MKSETLGILIIVAIIVIGIFTGGDIFRGGPIQVVPKDDQSSTDYSSESGSNYSDSSDSDSNNSNNSANDPSTDFTDRVYISRVTNPGSFNLSITLGASLNKGETALITGWKIKSLRTGQQMTIGGASQVANPGVLDQSPIILGPYSKVVVEPGTSPIGTSFRINKCSGYLAEKYFFEPTVYTSCPRPIDDIPTTVQNLNDECLDYIDSLPSCKIPHERDFPDEEEDGYSLTTSCETYLKTRVNYQNCIYNNVSDSDFLQNEWRVFTGFRGIFGFDKRDTLILIDNWGRTVDSYDI